MLKLSQGDLTSLKKDKNLDIIQYENVSEEDSVVEGDNKVLNSMAQVLKPFIDRLKYFSIFFII